MYLFIYLFFLKNRALSLSLSLSQSHMKKLYGSSSLHVAFLIHSKNSYSYLFALSIAKNNLFGLCFVIIKSHNNYHFYLREEISDALRDQLEWRISSKPLHL